MGNDFKRGMTATLTLGLSEVPGVKVVFAPIGGLVTNTVCGVGEVVGHTAAVVGTGVAAGVTFGQCDAVNKAAASCAKKAFDPDGGLTSAVEGIPLLGYTATAGHAIAAAADSKNRDAHLKRTARSMYKCNTSTAVAVASILAPGVGTAIAGAAVAGIAGTAAELGVNEALGEYGTGAGKYSDGVGSTLKSLAVGGAGGAIGGYMGAPGKGSVSGLSSGAKQLGMKGGKSFARNVGRGIRDTAIKAEVMGSGTKFSEWKCKGCRTMNALHRDRCKSCRRGKTFY